jgi:hypothetical protein
MDVCPNHTVQAIHQSSFTYVRGSGQRGVPLEHALDGFSDIMCEMESTSPW